MHASARCAPECMNHHCKSTVHTYVCMYVCMRTHTRVFVFKRPPETFTGFPTPPTPQSAADSESGHERTENSLQIRFVQLSADKDRSPTVRDRAAPP